MRFSHVLLAILLMVIWGMQFVVVHVAVETIPPFLLCSLRFFFTSIPLIFFFKRPTAPFKLVLLYGLLNFALQYSLFFLAMRCGMPAGLASLVYQIQILLSIGLAAIFFNERITRWQMLGIFIGFCGLTIVAIHVNHSATLLGFFLTIAAALVWAFGNVVSKKIGNVNMISLVVWGNFVSWPLLFIITWFQEGPTLLMSTWHHLTWLSIASVVYIVYFSTLVAFSLWSWLLSLYPIKTVIPFMLLIPVFGIFSAHFLLNESLPLWKLLATFLIVGGLCVNFFGRYLNLVWRSVRHLQ